MSDEGQAAVIQLARALPRDQVLIDERKGRKVARDIDGQRTLGTVRVLLEAKQSGLIDAIRQPLESMREHGYCIHQGIIVVNETTLGDDASLVAMTQTHLFSSDPIAAASRSQCAREGVSSARCKSVSTFPEAP